MAEPIGWHRKRARMARAVADAATRLAKFHDGIADQREKLADAAQGCTGQSRLQFAGDSPAGRSHEGDTV